MAAGKGVRPVLDRIEAFAVAREVVTAVDVGGTVDAWNPPITIWDAAETLINNIKNGINYQPQHQQYEL